MALLEHASTSKNASEDHSRDTSTEASHLQRSREGKESKEGQEVTLVVVLISYYCCLLNFSFNFHLTKFGGGVIFM